jgi:hypothetical protein
VRGGRRGGRGGWLIAVVAAVVGMALSVGARAQAGVSDAEQIAGLMQGLSDHSMSPAEVLDPNLSPAERGKSLRRLGAGSYELSLVPTERIPVITTSAAAVQVRVHFDRKDGNTLDANAAAEFVKRGDRWYFANFDFLAWPVFLIAVLVVGLLAGIGYGATVLVLAIRLMRRGPLGVDGVKVFFPIFWPGLFRELRAARTAEAEGRWVGR